MDVEKGLHGVEWCSWECTVTNNDTKTHTHPTEHVLEIDTTFHRTLDTHLLRYV